MLYVVMTRSYSADIYESVRSTAATIGVFATFIVKCRVPDVLRASSVAVTLNSYV